MTYMAVKSNFQQVLLKTLIPTMNTLKDMAVLKTDGKCAPEAKPGGLGINPKMFFFAVIFNFNQLCIKKLMLGVVGMLPLFGRTFVGM